MTFGCTFALFCISLSNDLSGVSFDPQPDGLYAEYMVGADAVRKKLGSQLIWVGTRVANNNNTGHTVTFDCKNIPGYQYFTNDSFVIIPNGTVSCRCKGEISRDTYTTCTAVLSYDPNTGILTTGIYGHYQPISGVYLNFDIGYDIYAVV